MSGANSRPSPRPITVRITISSGSANRARPNGCPSTRWNAKYTNTVGRKSKTDLMTAVSGNTARGNAAFMMRPRPLSSERAPAIIALLMNVNTNTAHTRWAMIPLRSAP